MTSERSDSDVIREAVELADGWSCQPDMHGDGVFIESVSGYKSTSYARDEITDALAAQLVRQIEKTDFVVHQYERHTEVLHHRGTMDYRLVRECHGDDRTMNTIRAIVESGVLVDE